MSCREVYNWWQQLWWWWQPPNFLSVTCCGEAFPGLGVQGVEGLILVGALFPLDGGREEKEREKKEERKGKKHCHGEGGFPWGWTHLAGCVRSGSQLLGATKG
jgi:hypothetical protein